MDKYMNVMVSLKEEVYFQERILEHAVYHDNSSCRRRMKHTQKLSECQPLSGSSWNKIVNLAHTAKKFKSSKITLQKQYTNYMYLLAQYVIKRLYLCCCISDKDL